ncbi:MAG: potassium channel family protein [Hyphomonadaceae bacterium]
MLFANLLLATLMVAITVVVHFLGLTGLISFAKRRIAVRPLRATVVRQGAMILAVVFGLFALHTIEIWLYAALYMVLGEFPTLEEALYFSTSTFTTVGFGEITLDENWRVLSAIESANGFLLIGWSTAYLVTMTGIMRDIDREIGEMRRDAQRRDARED